MRHTILKRFRRTALTTATASLLTLASVTAVAQTDWNGTINQLGVQMGGGSGSVAYFSLTGGTTLACQYSVLYVDLTTDWGRGILAQLIAAKHAGTVLSRIDYTQPGGAGTPCNVQLVEVQ